MQDLILSLDQGTTSTRAMLFNLEGNSLFTAQQEFTQYFPQNGWVEHDPEEIWQSTKTVIAQAMNAASKQNARVVSMGITNQRETIIVWSRATGAPIYNAIVWQDRRTAANCEALKQQGHEAKMSEHSGLLLDPYFSASKIAWILENVEGAQSKAEQGELCYGTIDSFLLWRLTAGKSHFTDVTNACRSALMNIQNQQWDEYLLDLFQVPKAGLPEIKPCNYDFGVTNKQQIGYEIPIQGMIGDQQGALVGQACLSPGMLKSTYGTGAFMVVNTGENLVRSSSKLLSTIGYGLDGKIHYAIEGSIFNAGTGIQWLRDQLGLVTHASETEALAAALNSNEGVYFVTAFTGLGAPHWNANARGTIVGLTRDSQKQHIVRATLESVVYQTHDLVQAIQADGQTIKQLRIDGGMSNNNWLAQFLADIINTPVARPAQTETTALGAAYVAALQCGLLNGVDSIEKNWQRQNEFIPQMSDDKRRENIDGWKQALKQTLC